MKRIFTFTLMAAVTLGAFFSCQKEINAPEEGKTPIMEEIIPSDDYVTWTFTADVETPDTKMSPMDGSNKFAWENNDEVKILYDGGSTTCNANVENGIATFSPSIPDGVSTIWLVYPSNIDASLSEGKLIIPMPSIQKDNLGGYFAAQAGKDEKTIFFIHPVSYHKFVVDGDGEDVTRVEITSSANNISASSISIDFSNSEPAVAAYSGGAQTLSYDFEGAGTYYIPIVPGAAAANDLYFQFYRGDEKAGAIKYGAALSNARASIVNWASLPAMATNRYVNPDAEGTKNGTTLAKAWNYTQFANFIMNNDSHLSAEQIDCFDGVKIHFAVGSYPVRSLAVKLKSNIKLYLLGAGSGDEDATIFDGGAAGYMFRQNEDGTPDGQTIVFRNIRFQNANRTNDNGGVFNIKFGKFVFEDCCFKDNKATSTESGKGGAGVANIYNTSTVVFRNCLFENNTAVERGGAIYRSSADATLTIERCTFNNNSALEGGAIYQTSGLSTIKETTFKSNSVSEANNWRGGGAICLNSFAGEINISNCSFTENTANNGSGGAIRVNNGFAKIDNCVFSKNSAKRGGAILAHTKAKCFLHNVKMIDNNASDGWGLVTQSSDQYTTICANNLTVKGNHKGNSNSGAVFNNNWATLILVNTTAINQGDAIVRFADNDGATFYLLNSILLNTTAATALNFAKTTNITSDGYSIIGGISGTFTPNSTDKIGKSYDNNVWTWDSSLLYTWTGTYDGTNYANDGINSSGIKDLVGAANAEFADWVTSIDEDGFTKDAHGTARGAHAWPGAYQN